MVAFGDKQNTEEQNSETPCYNDLLHVRLHTPPSTGWSGIHFLKHAWIDSMIQKELNKYSALWGCQIKPYQKQRTINNEDIVCEYILTMYFQMYYLWYYYATCTDQDRGACSIP